MTERPILFQGDMVRAILDGSKTQTRRALKGALPWGMKDGKPEWAIAGTEPRCPYGLVGDRLWVKETIRLVPDQEPDDGTGPVYSTYAADGSLTVADAWPWKRKQLNSIHCPRGLSRIDLEITDVRVERLTSISEADARAEGAPGYEEGIDAPPPDEDCEWSYYASYWRLWERINGPGSWEANPWVWCVSFRRIET